MLARWAGLPERYPELSKFFGPGPPLAAYFAFVQNFFFAAAGHGGPEWLSVTWSLAVEEQFYLCSPFVIFLVPRRRLGAVLLRQAPVLRTWTDAAVTAGAVAVTLGLAALSWHFFESRLVAWGHSFQYRLDRPAQPAPPDQSSSGPLPASPQSFHFSG